MKFWENIKNNLKDPEILQIICIMVLVFLVIESALIWAISPRITNIDNRVTNNYNYTTNEEITQLAPDIGIKTRGQCILVEPTGSNEAVMRCVLT